jgi:hypothetical protein
MGYALPDLFAGARMSPSASWAEFGKGGPVSRTQVEMSVQATRYVLVRSDDGADAGSAVGMTVAE